MVRMSGKLATYATPAEVRRLKRLRERSGLSQTKAGVALYTPLRTWQSWEDGKAKMHRVIWKAAISLLEAHAQRAERESAAQSGRIAAGVPPEDA
jgi:DNA-binding transcriptional regulator YiaG